MKTPLNCFYSSLARELPKYHTEWILTSQYWGNRRKADKEPDNWSSYRVTEKERQTFGFVLTFCTKTGDF